jgi:hypothetical protein
MTGALGEIPATGNTQLAGALEAGRIALDLGQQVTFQQYTRYILPIDGFVFWLPTIPFTAAGSLHYTQEIVQHEDETLGTGSITFTTAQKIAEFADIPLDTIYVASTDSFRYAFSQQNGFYNQAGQWHYFGRVISPAMESQLLDSPGQIDPTQPVVSNSLPFWLQLNNYAPPLANYLGNTIPIYPSFLIEPNLVSPYIGVHIGDADTTSPQMTSLLDQQSNDSQLCRDSVRLTLYGLQNNAARDFRRLILQYSEWTQNFGIGSIGPITDGKRPQAELVAIGMQKHLSVDVWYQETRAADVARQLITQALATVSINPY